MLNFAHNLNRNSRKILFFASNGRHLGAQVEKTSKVTEFAHLIFPFHRFQKFRNFLVFCFEKRTCRGAEVGKNLKSDGIGAF